MQLLHHSKICLIHQILLLPPHQIYLAEPNHKQTQHQLIFRQVIKVHYLAKLKVPLQISHQ
jgi:hypothetical protein